MEMSSSSSNEVVFKTDKIEALASDVEIKTTDNGLNTDQMKVLDRNS